MHGARVKGGERVREGQAGVVVGVDADRSLDGGAGVAGGRGDLIRQRAAVGVAQHDARGAGLGGGAETGRGVGRILLPAVDGVLAVVDDLAAVGLQERHSVGDHREVLLGRAAQHLADVEGGGLTVDGHDRGLDLEEAADLGVLGGADALLAGGAEGGELGVLELQLAGLGEELDVAGVGAGPAALDVGHPETLELLGDPHLVGDREMNAQSLRAVAEGGVVDLDFACHGGGGESVGGGVPGP